MGSGAAELVDLRWDQIDFTAGVLHVRRAKAGTPATHPLTGRELRALRRLQRETGPSTHLFMSERKAPISVDGFQKMVERLSARQGWLPGSRAHAAPRLRFQDGQRRRRHPHDPGLPRPQGHPAHGALHRAVAGTVQRAVEGLSSWLASKKRSYQRFQPTRWRARLRGCNDAWSAAFHAGNMEATTRCYDDGTSFSKSKSLI